MSGKHCRGNGLLMNTVFYSGIVRTCLIPNSQSWAANGIEVNNLPAAAQEQPVEPRLVSARSCTSALAAEKRHIRSFWIFNS